MGADDPELILAWLRKQETAMVELTTALVRAESPSTVGPSQHGPFQILARELESLSFVVRSVSAPRGGLHLYARPQARARTGSRQLVIGHMDTVWPLGTVDGRHVERLGDRLYGAGAFDMKAGLAQLVFALRALQRLGRVPVVTPVIFLNGDEELGSRDSGRYIRLLARASSRVFVLEPPFGPTGKLKTARKGIGRFSVVVHGRAAHAGSEPERGVSAILELAHQVQKLFALNDPAHGITVNVGTIDGGLRPNVVAPKATALVDVRVPSDDAARTVTAAIRALRPVGPGVTVEVEGAIGRPPMHASAGNRKLFDLAQGAGRRLGIDVEEAAMVGGGSDANIAARFAPTLDGLGPVGEGAHAEDEHVVVPRLPERAALLALLLLAPAATHPEGGRR
jgi:glutamate carboxypeptidase